MTGETKVSPKWIPAITLQIKLIKHLMCVMLSAQLNAARGF